jgi:hypothetical protein
MNNCKSVLLFSKYSSESGNIVERIKKSGVDFIGKMNLSTICIDNEAVRNRILGSNVYRIKSVPCVLVKTNSKTHKYEGSDAFAWVDDIISQLAEVSLVESDIPPQPQVETTPIPEENLGGQSSSDIASARREYDESIKRKGPANQPKPPQGVSAIPGMDMSSVSMLEEPSSTGGMDMIKKPSSRQGIMSRAKALEESRNKDPESR